MHRLLLSYFGTDFKYCLFYPDDPGCCSSFPCQRMGINFTKNHDFDLSGRIAPEIPYLVQYRSLMLATVSDFELYLLDGGEDTKESFQEFARIRADGWAGFMAKWVDASFSSERLLVRYEDLVSDATAILRRVIPFFSPNEVPDERRMASVIENEAYVAVTKQAGEDWKLRAGVKAFRKAEAFRFYDEEFFYELEMSAEKMRRQLNVAQIPAFESRWRRPTSAVRSLRASALKMMRRI